MPISKEYREEFEKWGLGGTQSRVNLGDLSEVKTEHAKAWIAEQERAEKKLAGSHKDAIARRSAKHAARSADAAERSAAAAEKQARASIWALGIAIGALIVSGVHAFINYYTAP